jgi:threonine dehydrogenase-like Zn-dependent dehydrogenase
VLVEVGRIEVNERPLRPLGRHDVLIKVTACGVCAGDVDFWLGKSDRPMPASLGHEVAGVVLEAGRDVTTLAPGDTVACWVDDGGYSEALVSDERFCVAVDENCPYPAVAEPLSCVVNAVGLAAPQLADDVVIIGAGFMGNLLQLAVQLRGPRTVTVADVRPGALERAAHLGATYTVDTASEDLADRVAEITSGHGADLSFEVTGTNAGLELAEAATRMSGKLCIVGYHQGGARSIRLGHWNWMAFNIVNAHFRDKSTILSGMRAGLRLMSAGALDVRPLVTNTYPLERIAEAFQAAAAKPDGFVKAVIEPNGTAHPGAAPAEVGGQAFGGASHGPVLSGDQI